MQIKALITALSVLVVLSAAFLSSAAELESRYAKIAYETEEDLRKFNDGVRLRSLSYLARNRNNLTVADEVGTKVDVLTERVKTVLEMSPKTLKFTIVLLPSESDVRRVYRARYGKSADFIAFYAPKEGTVYLSVDDVTLHVLAHELAHVVIDHYLGVSPSSKIHEVLAQYAEEHLED